MKKNIDITPNLETLFGTRDENLRALEKGPLSDEEMAFMREFGRTVHG